MHPTVPGYTIIADAVLEAIGSPARTDKDLALRNDTLLNNIPPLLDFRHTEVLGLASIVRQLGEIGIASSPKEKQLARPKGTV